MHTDTTHKTHSHTQTHGHGYSTYMHANTYTQALVLLSYVHALHITYLH